MTRPNNAHISKKFGSNLSKVLTFIEMSSAELSRTTGLTPACISQIISGKREPTLSTVVKILEVIPVNLERLLR